jgi:hypothetical protein
MARLGRETHKPTCGFSKASRGDRGNLDAQFVVGGLEEESKIRATRHCELLV